MAYQSSQQFQWHYTDYEDSNFRIRGRTLFFIIVLISLLLIITLLFLYAWWICRFNRIPPPSTTFSVGNRPHAPPNGLDSDMISNLPITLYRLSSVNEATECSICLGIFTEGDKVKVLPNCGHCYHSECVDKWLITHSSCPLCRGSLRVDSLV